jgi:hypothetical protein
MTMTGEDFDWVSAQAACTSTLMFQRLLDGARKDTERRTFTGGDLRFEFHSDEPEQFEVNRATASGKVTAVVTFEHNGPRIEIHGDGVDVQMTAVVGINAAGECRYFVGEAEYLGWEIRKMALDVLFFESQDE